jgi:hypothetical protein
MNSRSRFTRLHSGDKANLDDIPQTLFTFLWPEINVNTFSLLFIRKLYAVNSFRNVRT